MYYVFLLFCAKIKRLIFPRNGRSLNFQKYLKG